MLAILGEATPFSAVMEWIRRRGLVVNIVTTGIEGLRAHGETSADLVLVGLPLPDSRAASLIAGLRRQDPRAIIVVAGIDEDVRSQLQALELGAHEYVSDPIDGRKDLLFALGVSLGMRKGDTQLRVLRAKDAAAAEWRAVVANCHEMRLAMAKLRAVCERTTARSVPTVLLTGELGTGKRLIAKAIHYNGGRRTRAFVDVSCSGPAQQLHAHLFGHEPDAFPDARATRQGVLELLHGGTVFLDEVGAIPLEMQPDLLSAIEDKQIRRLGGSQAIHVDVQIIAATRRDLGAMVKRGELRADLYTASTWSRSSCHHFAKEARTSSRSQKRWWRASRPSVASHRRSLQQTPGLPSRRNAGRGTSASCATSSSGSWFSVMRPRSPQSISARSPATRASRERELIRQALVRCGNVSKTARYLDLTRQTLLYRMKKYGFASPSNPG